MTEEKLDGTGARLARLSRTPLAKLFQQSDVLVSLAEITGILPARNDVAAFIVTKDLDTRIYFAPAL
jgi:hypothetical protein